ncbi:MAG: acyclic terpene utilization AtuA family protein [Balneolaceae bacterium]|nr:acyclic terpene utilization AtuA family protein [Balneolaceae bacterium]
MSANAYLGARPIVEALQQDADIIITGRVYDAGLIVGPMMHEFAWDFEDYDKVASGICRLISLNAARRPPVEILRTGSRSMILFISVFR